MKISSLAKNSFFECFGKSMSFLGVGLGASQTAVILIEKETLFKGDWLTITGNAFCAVLGLTLDVSGVGMPVGLTLNTIGVVCGLVSWYIGSEIIVPLENGYYLCLTQV